MLYTTTDKDRLFDLRSIDGFVVNRSLIVASLLSMICIVLNIFDEYRYGVSSKILVSLAVIAMFNALRVLPKTDKRKYFQRGIDGSPTRKILYVSAIYFVTKSIPYATHLLSDSFVELAITHILIVFVWLGNPQPYSRTVAKLCCAVSFISLLVLNPTHTLYHLNILAKLMFLALSTSLILQTSSPNGVMFNFNTVVDAVCTFITLFMSTSSMTWLTVVLNIAVMTYLNEPVKLKFLCAMGVGDIVITALIQNFTDTIIFGTLPFLTTVLIVVSTIRASREPLFWRNKRAYCSGVFDLMHEGHMELFKNMSAHGDVIVGVLDDETVESYKRKPIMTHAERCDAVKSAKYVDEIIPHGPLYTTSEFMREHNIDVVGIGEEYLKPPYQYYEDCVAEGKYVKMPRYTGISTSDLIKRIKKRDDL
ncbi:cytidylyltransferase [Yasminevirus sp. GU-2018]|uniref:ethanolamine-phosphate cytidylyltransferase n=1 Tax=Yasminevirus sp. GU-2018 TaxID=2420051 RepID=A0A5K0U9B1_9VIRU|nr:cytidylyltransferase [Yasminevirus sp. GU-2018]